MSHLKYRQSNCRTGLLNGWGKNDCRIQCKVRKQSSVWELDSLWRWRACHELWVRLSLPSFLALALLLMLVCSLQCGQHAHPRGQREQAQVYSASAEHSSRPTPFVSDRLTHGCACVCVCVHPAPLRGWGVRADTWTQSSVTHLSCVWAAWLNSWTVCLSKLWLKDTAVVHARLRHSLC